MRDQREKASGGFNQLFDANAFVRREPFVDVEAEQFVEDRGHRRARLTIARAKELATEDGLDRVSLPHVIRAEAAIDVQNAARAAGAMLVNSFGGAFLGAGLSTTAAAVLADSVNVVAILAAVLMMFAGGLLLGIGIARTRPAMTNGRDVAIAVAGYRQVALDGPVPN